MDTPDRIEREIKIDAQMERVWGLVAEPGWWIGDGDRSGQRRSSERGLQIVDDPRYGQFPIRVLSLEPPRHASFRWASAFPGEDPGDGNSTLIDFWLSERDGGTLLRVVESGFAGVADASERDGNAKGWEEQLDILKRRAERVSV
jgi:uncharacterized protein YndB with AHSA1/START domain